MIRTLCFCVTFLFWHHVALSETRVLIVGTAPDHEAGSHAYQAAGQLLADRWNQHDAVTATAAVGWPVDPQLLADLDVIVFYSRPVGDLVLQPDHRNRFVQLMERGTGLVCIHWSTGVGYSELADQPEMRDTFLGLLGGWFRRPPCGIKITSAELTQVATAHPICRGWEPYTIRDEFYLEPRLHPNSQALVQVEIDDKRHTVAWAFERRAASGAPKTAGRSVGITLGHFHSNFSNPEFQQLLTNAMMWAAKAAELPAADK